MASAHGIPSEIREEVRCPSCNLVQFFTRNGKCRRCSTRLDEERIPGQKNVSHSPAAVFSFPPTPSIGHNLNIDSCDFRRRLGDTMRYLRGYRMHTLKALAERSATSVCFLSRLENSESSITMKCLEPVTNALEVNASAVLHMAISSSLDAPPPFRNIPGHVGEYLPRIFRNRRMELKHSPVFMSRRSGVTQKEFESFEAEKKMLDIVSLYRITHVLRCSLSGIVRQAENMAINEHSIN